MPKQKEHAYKRMIVGKNVKFRLKEIYKDIAIYEEVCPTGYVVSQSWLLMDQNLCIFINSYNNMCKEELLDAIDNRKYSGEFGFRGFMKIQGFVVHPNGKDTL